METRTSREPAARDPNHGVILSASSVLQAQFFILESRIDWWWHGWAEQDPLMSSECLLNLECSCGIQGLA